MIPPFLFHMNLNNVPIHDSDIEPTRRRLELNTYLVFTIMLITSFLMGDSKIIFGTLLGGGLGLLNYRWLSSSLRVIIPTAAQMNRIPRWTAAKFILRYVVIGLAIGSAWWSGRFDLLAVVIGFCAFVVALMIEAVYQIWLMVGRNEEGAK